MTLRLYLLGENHEVIPCECSLLDAVGEGEARARYMEWAVETFGEDGERRIVGQTTAPSGMVISTVFLGLDHGTGDDEPLVFETLVTADNRKRVVGRYATWDEAARGHSEWVAAADKVPTGLWD